LRARSQLKLGVLDAVSDARQSGNQPLLKLFLDVRRLADRADSLQRTDLKQAFELYSRILHFCPQGIYFLVRAASCAWQLGGNASLTALLARAPEDRSLIELDGRVRFCDGDVDGSLSRVHVCESSDTNCSLFLRLAGEFRVNFHVAEQFAISKPIPEPKSAIARCRAIANEICPSNSKLFQTIESLRVPILIAESKPSDALRILNALLSESPNSVDLLLARGDLFLSIGDRAAAIVDFEIALIANPGNTRAQKGIAAARVYGVTEVDFYDLLGVAQDSPVDQIKEAYRESVRIWHPDKFTDAIQKREAERKMKELNRALEVLTNHEKRMLYDQGRDPDTGRYKTHGRRSSRYSDGNPLEQLYRMQMQLTTAQWYQYAFGL
jgi:tetratricopeptide (TPR) repeat protein